MKLAPFASCLHSDEVEKDSTRKRAQGAVCACDLASALLWCLCKESSGSCRELHARAWESALIQSSPFTRVHAQISEHIKDAPAHSRSHYSQLCASFFFTQSSTHSQNQSLHNSSRVARPPPAQDPLRLPVNYPSRLFPRLSAANTAATMSASDLYTVDEIRDMSKEDRKVRAAVLCPRHRGIPNQPRGKRLAFLCLPLTGHP